MSTYPGNTPAVERGGLAATTIGPVEVPKPAEVFADILRNKIFSGELRTGDPLPPERILVEQSQLSRSSVREALHILKQQGLVTTRAGRNGGSIVTTPSADDLIASMDVYLQSRGWGNGHQYLTEMREIIQPWCAAFAAAKRTDQDLAELDLIHERTIRDVDYEGAYTRASQAWHFAVADASHNVLISALVRVRSDELRVATSPDRYDTLAARQLTIQHHAEILESIRAKDPVRAFELMGDHVKAGELSLLERLATEAAE